MTHCFVIIQFHLIGRVNLPQHSMVHVDESHSWPLLATRGDPPINSAHGRIRKRLESNWMIQSGERTWQFTFISPSSWILYYNLWRPEEGHNCQSFFKWGSALITLFKWNEHLLIKLKDGTHRLQHFHINAVQSNRCNQSDKLIDELLPRFCFNIVLDTH